MKHVFVVVDKLLEIALFVILLCMCGVVATNVFCRFVLHFSLSWADEVAIILMVWFTFLGAAIGMREGTHYAFDFLVKSLTQKYRIIASLLGQLICITMLLALVYWSGKVTVLIRHWVMPATEISRALVYSACPVGATFMLLYVLKRFFEQIAFKTHKAVDTSKQHDSMTEDIVKGDQIS